MSELRYFGMDEEKSDFVVFEMDREDDLNIFFWVDISSNVPDIMIVPSTRFFSYLSHTASPFYVKEDGVEDKIEKALAIIEDFPKDKLKERFEGLNEFLQQIREKDIDEVEDQEETMEEEVKEARNGSGYWPFEPEVW